MNHYDYNTLLELEMLAYREEALKKLQKVIAPAFVEEFAKILQYSWQDGLKEAEILSEELNLYPLDFSALDQNVKAFEDLLFKDKEMRWEEYA